MKYKKLTREQLLISFDRLTRFKHPSEKYIRVFCDVIISNSIEPKYKKSALLKMSAENIRDIAVEIINGSLDSIQNDHVINEIIYNYENNIYNISPETEILINNNINYNAAIKLIDDNSPFNLQWLKTLSLNKNSKEARQTYGYRHPIEKVALVEGLTEELLLPVFAARLGHDFSKNGIQIIPAGGKNQVVKMYYKLLNDLKIPIFLLLDKDAEENISQIKPKLRDIDKIHIVSCGEFEDLLPKSLIVKTINKELNNFASISENDLQDNLPEVKNLENIFKEKGLHEYKKADFAKLVSDNISSEADISAEIRTITEEIANL